MRAPAARSPVRTWLSLPVCLLVAVCALGCRTEVQNARPEAHPDRMRQAAYPAAAARDAEKHAEQVTVEIRRIQREISAKRTLANEYRIRAQQALRDPLLSPDQKHTQSSYYNGLANRTIEEIGRLRQIAGRLEGTVREHKADASEHHHRSEALRDGEIPVGARRYR